MTRLSAYPGYLRIDNGEAPSKALEPSTKDLPCYDGLTVATALFFPSAAGLKSSYSAGLGKLFRYYSHVGHTP